MLKVELNFDADGRPHSRGCGWLDLEWFCRFKDWQNFRANGQRHFGWFRRLKGWLSLGVSGLGYARCRLDLERFCVFERRGDFAADWYRNFQAQGKHGIQRCSRWQVPETLNRMLLAGMAPV